MSLLRAEGHLAPEHYPFGYLHDEANLVVERQNARMLTEAELLRQSVASILSKEGGKQLKKFRDRLNVEVRPRRDLFGDTTGE